MGNLQQHWRDLVPERFEGREVVQRRSFLFHFLPELLDGIVIRRVSRQREDRQALSVHGKEALHRGSGVRLRPLLHQNERWRGVLQHAREKGAGGIRVEPSLLALIPEPPGTVVDQAKDVVAFTRARGLDQRLVAPSGPGVREGPPLRAGSFIAKEQPGLALLGEAQHLGPRRGAPGLPLACIQMLGDDGRFVRAQAQVLQSLGDGEDVGEDAEALVNQLLDHGRAPAGTATTGLGRPFGKKGGEGGFRRRGQFGRAAREQLAWCPLEPIATERAHPGGDGLLVDAQDPCALCETLAIHDGKDGEEMRDLAQVTQLLGRLELPFHGFAGASGESKTDAAPRDTPPKTTCERGFFGRHFPDVWPLVNLSSEILFLKVYSYTRLKGGV